MSKSRLTQMVSHLYQVRYSVGKARGGMSMSKIKLLLAAMVMMLAAAFIMTAPAAAQPGPPEFVNPGQGMGLRRDASMARCWLVVGQ